MLSERRALVAYSMSSTFVQTTLDYLAAFKRFSGFDVDYIHITHHAHVIPDFNSYDVIFHNYCARLCYHGYVSESYLEKAREFKGVKVLAVQDEYDHTDVLKAAIKDIGFNIVLTCVPQDRLEYVYPKAEFPDVEFITVFTGYVPEDFAVDLPAPTPLAERPIFIGYRGRDIGGRYGRLGFDKFEVGRRMKELCDERGIATDIAMDEASRIYGKAWLEFVGSCRAMLGSESGSNVFDFDGSIEARFKEMTEANGGVAPSYADFLPIVAERDNEIEMGQISPRVFECAMMRTPMVLFRGRYSDAILPDEHYITLEKDFSNLDEVLGRLEDIPALEAMTQRAFDHLVGSGRFTYRVYFKDVAVAIERHLVASGRVHPEPAATVFSAATVDASGVVREPATPWPLGETSFKVRQGAADAAVYRRELDRLIAEFAHLRSLFEPEMGLIYNRYISTLGLFGAMPEGERPILPGWTYEKCDLAKLLATYDSELAAMSLERPVASREFEAALAAGVEDASSEALRRTLAIEKDGYFHLIEWIRRLNEVYDAERLLLARAFRERINELSATLLPRLPLNRQIYVRLRLFQLRVRLLLAATLRKIIRSAGARRLLVALPAIGPLARQIAMRLKLSGLP